LNLFLLARRMRLPPKQHDMGQGFGTAISGASPLYGKKGLVLLACRSRAVLQTRQQSSFWSRRRMNAPFRLLRNARIYAAGALQNLKMRIAANQQALLGMAFATG
jgi:hypothetical protein